ncbi:anti-sigma factor domain-containing protein [Roseovarius sp. MMSF_3281]|uniref:anti-sigma factor n=1 Tax=Roseovarius sp. MMSF_3281 TaxID=3046694 RepID=UPI00273F899D|nr:anti-sigma factor [Roseovarius sp. MMSF_3281]
MSGELPERDADKALAGEYALGLLSAEAAADFEARLVNEPDLRALYAEWCEDLAALTDRIDPVAPPPRLQGEVEAALFGKPRGRAGWIGALLGGLAVAALVLGLIFGADLLPRGPQAPADPAYVAEVAAEDGSLVVAAAYDAEAGALFVDRRAGAAREGRALELWLIAGENAPVSLGVLPGEAQAALDIPAELRAQLDGGVLAISDEPSGGSPTGAPTGDVLAVGPITNT